MKALVSGVVVLLLAAAVTAVGGYAWLRARVNEPYQAYQQPIKSSKFRRVRLHAPSAVSSLPPVSFATS